MDFFEKLLPHGPFLMPFLFVLVLYGVRYLVITSAFFMLARPTAGGGYGRVHASAPASFNTKKNVSRELWYSCLAILVFALVNGVLFAWQWLSASLIYTDISRYPIWWFWLSIPAMIILHDTFFYWLHRAMHTRLLFKHMHKIHHRSVHPTAFAAYSFHPSESLAEALIVVAILYIIPIHPYALLIFQFISTSYNVYAHCGREFFPTGMSAHPLGRWINTSSNHAQHHFSGHHNYGFYFMAWDRWMKTAAPPQA